MDPENNPYATAFSCEVPAGGFVWIDGPTKTAQGSDAKGPWLVPEAGPGKPIRFEIPDNLFEEFGALAMDEGSIRRFANRFGVLGTEEVIPRVPARTSTKRYLGTGERLRRWRMEIMLMKAVTELAGAVNAKDAKRVRAWIKIGDGTATLVTEDKKADILSTRSVKAPAIRQGRPSEAARIVMQNVTNKKLLDASQVGVVRDGNTMRLLIFANSLLGVMWIQFARSMSQDRIRLCENCKDVLVLLHGHSRKHKRTCSKTCNNALNYKRKAKKGRK